MKRTLSIVVLAALVLMLSAGAWAQDAKIPRPSKLNAPPEGFTALFNGTDLAGWKGLVADPEARAKMSAEDLAKAQVEADAKMRAHWKVEDGVLVFDGKGDSLCTAKDYADFEMLVDWKILPKGDSGVYLRGSPQVQIWDPAMWPVGSGGLYNNQKNPKDPLKCADKPIGEWNTFWIRMVGEKVTIYLNDVLVVDNVVLENYWDRSKPIYPSGQIELQNHGNNLYFRNVFVKELSTTPAAQETASGDWKTLFNGKDFAGWEEIGAKSDSWKVTDDGGFYCSGGKGGWLATTEEYGDFELELEFKLPENGNSGVFIRAPREGNPAYEGHEIQVLDDNGSEYTKLKDWQYCGSLYDLLAPSSRVSKKAGEWQKYNIVAKGQSLKVTLNGTQIIDADLTKFMDRADTHPGLKRAKGIIGLQNHSSRVDYRNIRIREPKN